MIKKYITILLSLLCFYNLNAQNKVDELQIGDTIPDLIIENLVKYSNSTTKDELKKKIIVLDFFATWCTSCVAALPHLDSLQKMLLDDLSLFVVTNESKQIINNFLRKNHIGKKINLPFVTNDSVLKNHFPHQTIPHEIIIKDGRVRAITYPEYINQSVLSQISEGKTPAIPLKKELPEFNIEDALESNPFFKSLKRSSSAFYSYVPELTTKSKIIKKDGFVRHVYINHNALHMYYRTLPDTFPRNRIVLEVPDVEKFVIASGDIAWNTWSRMNAFCYEMIVSDSITEDEQKKKIKADLDSYLGLSTKVEKRLVKCYALKVIDSNKIMKAITNDSPVLSISRSDSVKIIRNLPVSELIEALNHQVYPRPICPIVIDRTNYRGLINLRLEIDYIQNLERLKFLLPQLGLKLELIETELDVFVVAKGVF